MGKSGSRYQVAPPGGADDHGQSGDDVVSRGHHRKEEDGAQEAAKVVDGVLEPGKVPQVNFLNL